MRHVSFNYACDRDTRELGEDYPELQKIERAYRLLEARLERAAVKVHSRRATKSILDFGAIFADARHDASFGSTLLLAQDAYAEAMVRPVKYGPVPKVANAGISERLDSIALKRMQRSEG